MAKTPPTVSLVLGSGGARGLAHIGVIEWLEAQGFRIVSIAGASMGALIGGIYAAGKLDLYRDWVVELERMDVLRLLDLSFSSNGLIKGDRVIGVLRELIGECDIEGLPISFTAVATDLDRQREVWLNRGPLFDAIRASIAIPTVFTPVVREGRTLVEDLFDVVARSMDTMQNAMSRFQLAAYSPDAVVEVPCNACAFFEFWRARELIAIGRERAGRALAGLVASARPG